jgi:hypothetical protein
MVNANDRSVVPIANLKEFFKDSLHETLTAQKLSIDAHTAHYIVNLLVLFARSDALFERTSEGMRVKPLVVMLGEALEARSAEERRRGLQRLGDVSLFIAGFFSRSFARKLVDIEYHIAMGGRAYAALASSVSRTRLDALTNVYAELADKFQPIVDVLNELSESGTPHSNEDVLRLYEIWLKTGSKRSYGLLQRLGVTPAPGMRLASAH